MRPDPRRGGVRLVLSTLIAVLLVLVVCIDPVRQDRIEAHATTAVSVPLRVAVVRSQATIDWVDRHRLGYDHSGKSDAAYTYLVERGWNVTQIGDAALEDLATLESYDVVLMPYVFAMDPLASRTMVCYVARGGGLVSALGSPRVAPSYDVSPDEVWSEHWVRIMNYEGWEWGPLSEAYQTYFVDDNFTPSFDVRSSSHEIVEAARRIVSSRGFSNASMDLVRDPGAGLELVTMLHNNTNAEPFATFRIHDSSVTQRYPLTYPAGVASRYLDGRSVYFYFSPMDFLPTYHRWLSDKHTSAGTPQGEVAGAYLEAALAWAATDDGTRGVINRGARTRATVDVYQDGIYAHQYLSNQGNVSTSGTLTYTVWDPSGSKVATWTRYMAGIAPGTEQRYSHQYVTGGLADGQYRIQVRYVFTYPDYRQSWTEEVRVRRGQGIGIATTPTEIVTDDAPNGNPCGSPQTANSRFDTAVTASQAAFPDGADTVIIATGRNWPDALGGSALAGALDGPILLVNTTSVPEAVAGEVDRLGASKAVIIGGEAAVSSAVARVLSAGELSVERIAGVSRYETADLVAQRVMDELGEQYDGTAFVATGASYADAVAAAPLAAAKGWPLYLAHPTDGITDEMRDAFGAIDRVVVLGGSLAVSAQTQAEIAGYLDGGGVVRLAGTSRYETAAKTAAYGVETAGLSWNRVGIATGQAYPDALAGGVMQGRMGSVMLLTRSTSLDKAAADSLTRNKAAITTVTYFGGELAVSAAVRAAVAQVLE